MLFSCELRGDLASAQRNAHVSAMFLGGNRLVAGIESAQSAIKSGVTINQSYRLGLLMDVWRVSERLKNSCKITHGEPS
jgi:hypothetical protein